MKIKRGILPHPVVKRPEEERNNIKQIGYFPETVLEPIENVQILKRKGVSMEEMAKRLRSIESLNREDTGRANRISPEFESVRLKRSIASDPRGMSAEEVKLTIDDLGYAAYLVNAHFEIEWINREAEEEIFRKNIHSIAHLEARNIFKLLFH